MSTPLPPSVSVVFEQNSKTLFTAYAYTYPGTNFIVDIHGTDFVNMLGNSTDPQIVQVHLETAGYPPTDPIDFTIFPATTTSASTATVSPDDSPQTISATGAEGTVDATVNDNALDPVTVSVGAYNTSPT